MGWEKPAGYTPPDEQRAAEEAAQKMAEARELADRQSAALADAIHDGFAMVAAAIVAASEHPMPLAIERYNEARYGDGDERVDMPTDFTPAAAPPPPPPDLDDGIDDILDDTPASIHVCDVPSSLLASLGSLWVCPQCGQTWRYADTDEGGRWLRVTSP